MGLPCERCLPEIPEEATRERVYKELVKNGTLRRDYQLMHKQWRLARRFESFFKKVIGANPWGAQRTWSRRLARGDSFSIIAPTGVGKTTFGLLYSLFLACRGHGRSYIILPTTPLVVQAVRKLEEYMEKASCTPRIAYYHSRLKKREREEMLSAIEKGEFDILVTTVAFTRSKTGLVEDKRFRLVFVDDVDAVMKSGKSISAILRVTGFPLEAQEKGLELYYLKRRIAFLSSRGISAEKIVELESKAEKLNRELEKYRSKAASLVVSSATGRPRGVKAKLFKVLLGFEVGGRGDIGVRRIIDSYHAPGRYSDDIVVDLVKKLGGGGLVFVPVDKGVEYAESLAGKIRDAGLNAEAFHSKKPISLLEEFEEGKIDVLVGVANYYGVLVRGIDMPWRVKYAVFAGVPRMKFAARVDDPHPLRIMRLLGIVSEVLEGDLREEALRYLAALRKVTRRLSPAALQLVAEKIAKGDEGLPGSVERVVMRALSFLRQALELRDVRERLRSKSDIGIVEEEGELYILVPDPYTYLQASGRTSRMYAGGITLGLSIVVVDDERVFRGLEARVRYIADAEWKPLEELDLEDIKKKLDMEREKLVRIRKKGASEDLVRTALLIVESPNKARTIASFFGRPSIRELPNGLRAYEVSTGGYILSIAASGGHVYDLIVDNKVEGDLPRYVKPADVVHGVVRDEEGAFIPVYTTIKRCIRTGRQTTLENPECKDRNGVPDRVRDSSTVIGDLRRLAWEVDLVLLGTDPDTEGEKISKDLYLLLKPYSQSIARLEFHEVTKKAILEALSSLRNIDGNLVDAQTVRRIEDRWIGFTLSPLLWYDFWPSYCKELLNREGGGREEVDIRLCREYKFYTNLSAGRVQTPTLGWIIERTREHKSSITLRHTLVLGERNYVLRLYEDELPEHVVETVREISEGSTVLVELASENEETLNPPPPFTTDELISEASRRLRMNASQAMRIAQNLFELGLITYHRTDSHRVSERGRQVARDYLREVYGDKYMEYYHPRTWGEGGAHEAIRPTRPIDAERLRELVEEGYIELASELTRDHYRLYDLIFRRFIASQMKPARVLYRAYRFKFKDTVIAEERVPFKALDPGFLEVYSELRITDKLYPGGIPVTEVSRDRVSHVPLFTDGDVVRLMREKGIGRPSTYAKILDTIKRRRYVYVIKQTGQLVSTRRGEQVYKYLIENFEELVSEERTRIVEEKMDKIEKGEAERDQVLGELYWEVKPLVEQVKKRIPSSLIAQSGPVEN